jgi:hypothetical protein
MTRARSQKIVEYTESYSDKIGNIIGPMTCILDDVNED